MSRRLNAVFNLSLFLIMLIMGGVTVGCGSGVKDVRVTLLPTNRLNPDESGAPLSVIVRVYQLRNRERFERADFRALWKNDEKVLEGDLLERKEITVYPDTKTSVELQVDQKKGVQFLGIMALFRKPQGELWRQVTSSDVSSWIPFKTPTVKLILDEHKVKLKD
jgi:type VI secretion system protein VasD